MTRQKKIFAVILAGISALGVFLDQLTKWLAVTYLAPRGSVHLLPHVVDLTYVENDGCAFGMLDDQRWIFMVVSCIAIPAVMAFVFTYKEKKDTLAVVALSLIASGGIGNMIDRIRLGYVVDFIDVSPLFSFAVFNGADSFVCVGACLLVLALVLDWVREEKEKKRAGEPRA